MVGARSNQIYEKASNLKKPFTFECICTINLKGEEDYLKAGLCLRSCCYHNHVRMRYCWNLLPISKEDSFALCVHTFKPLTVEIVLLACYLYLTFYCLHELHCALVFEV